MVTSRIVKTWWLAAIAAAGLCLASSTATAQLTGVAGTTGIIGTGGTTGTTSLTSADFSLTVQSPAGTNLDNTQLPRFFNKANCDCSVPVYLYLVPVQAIQLATNNVGTISMWIGSECSTTIENTGTTTCIFLASEPLPTFFSSGNEHWTVATDVRTLSQNTSVFTQLTDGGVITSNTPTTDCTTPGVASFTQTISVLIDVDGDGIPDVTVQTEVLVDLTPPPPPTNITVQGGDEAVVLNWTGVDQTVTTDLLGYQVLCNRAGSLQVFPNNTFGSGYFSDDSVCGMNGGLTGVDALDPLYNCSPQLSANTSAYRVKILSNNIWYGCAVVAIDNSGNPSAPQIIYGMPQKTLSFYDVYRDGTEGTSNNQNDPGGASGGFCAVATTRPRAGAVVLLAAAFATGAIVIARRRRSRGRK